MRSSSICVPPPSALFHAHTRTHTHSLSLSVCSFHFLEGTACPSLVLSHYTMPRVAPSVLIGLQAKTSHIRNLCVLAHVDHGELHFFPLDFLGGLRRLSCSHPLD